MTLRPWLGAGDEGRGTERFSMPFLASSFLARGSAITRSDAFAVIVAKLGFNPLSSAGRETGRFPPTMRHGRRFGREPCPLASRVKALVWHDERMAKDVSRGPSYEECMAKDVSRGPSFTSIRVPHNPPSLRTLWHSDNSHLRINRLSISLLSQTTRKKSPGSRYFPSWRNSAPTPECL